MLKCKCGRELKPHWVKCPDCKTLVAQPNTGAKCASCGEDMEDTWDECPACGAKTVVKMTDKFIIVLDWDSAIAKVTCTIETDKTSVLPCLYRGIAYCFKPDKEGKYIEATKDLSIVIAKGTDKEKAEARLYRTFAYYLIGDYEKAISECENLDEPRKSELLGKIFVSMGKYQEAAKAFANALKWYYSRSFQSSVFLLCEYNDACKKMNSV